jgi:hypothetical protein
VRATTFMAANIPLALPKQCSEGSPLVGSSAGLTSGRKQVRKNSTKFRAIWYDL